MGQNGKFGEMENTIDLTDEDDELVAILFTEALTPMESLKEFMKLHPAWRLALFGCTFLTFLVIAAHRDALDSIAHLLQAIPFIVSIPVYPSGKPPEKPQDSPPEPEDKPAK